MRIKVGRVVLATVPPRPTPEVCMDLQLDILGTLTERVRASKDRIANIVDGLHEVKAELTRIYLEMDAIHKAAESRSGT